MSALSRSPSIASIAALLPNGIANFMHPRAAEEDEAPAVVSEIKLSLDVINVQAALPEALRPLFTAKRADGFVLLTRKGSTQISRGELGENLVDATRVLIAKTFAVWPSEDGCSLEVSRADAPHFIPSTPFEWTPGDESEADDGR